MPSRIPLGSISTIVVCASVLSFWGTAYAQDLIVTGPFTISTDITYDNVVVQSGGVLTVDAVLTVTNDMTIASGGVVTHSLRYESGLVLNVIGTLDVETGGLIDLNAKGLRGGNNGSLFGSQGEVNLVWQGRRWSSDGFGDVLNALGGA